MDNKVVLRRAWEQLCSTGTASPAIARNLRVGLGPFLESFQRRYLGPEGLGNGFKLVLGMNGEGKTHLLLCLRELALQSGHAVALIDPKTSLAGDSPLLFAQEVLRRIETLEGVKSDDGMARVPSLLRSALSRKREALISEGLDPDALLPIWADGFRTKDIHPHGVSDALADGLLAVLAEDSSSISDASSRLTIGSAKLTKQEQIVQGSHLLQSIPFMLGLLGFQSLVILLDEAETAIEKKGSAKRREFLKFLRYLNDHVANNPDERAGAMVIIGCTDEFWPEQFLDYTALHSRLVDPGLDELEMRRNLTPGFLVRLNKIWVRETFRGDESDYIMLGTALVELAKNIYPNLDPEMQAVNVKSFAETASSDQVKREIKRIFIKALCNEIETQVLNDAQRTLAGNETRTALDSALNAINTNSEEGQ